ncbi:MAG: type II toxin-antitoxin system HipA family toxin [Clostridiales bacterium]|nr:type II toxin-antitoxin system HipA family toxin [Clostridiales bacterium]
MSKTIYVYENFTDKEPMFMGTLYVDVFKNKEHYSFEYDMDWLAINRFRIDPNLQLYTGRQFKSKEKKFGIFYDSAPDRWGRTLLKRKEARQAEKEDRMPRGLYESDFLLGIYDETRMGALRFKLDKDGEFLSSDKEYATPPWASLRELEHISYSISNDEDVSDEWLDMLFKPGSSLGGARPKANVIDPEGNLWIAKFPAKNDDVDVGAWEKVASDLARLCGLNVPETKLEQFSKNGHTFLTKRFDRDQSRRIHFASAMTLLGKTDGEDSSYLNIANFIKSYGANTKEDLIELWKRIVFNMAIRNTDDHLRNHGFILAKTGWALSPLYDVNSTPRGNQLDLYVDFNNPNISKELALSVSKHFGINRDDGEIILKNICKIIQDNWESLATKYGIGREKIIKMQSAFSFAKENA